MKKLMQRFAIVATLLMIASSAFAADGSSGCGPGWYLFDKDSLVSSSLRLTTNTVLFPVVTIGMTSGTSNCQKHSIVMREKQSLHFVTMNYYELKGNVARASGEHLSAFSRTLGCSAESATRLGQQLQKNYEVIFPDQNLNPENALLEVYKTILRDETLTHQCGLNIG
jgi:hypothetical protein